MSRENVETKVHEAVESAISNDIGVKEFIRMAAVSWEQALLEKNQHAQSSFQKLLDVKGIY